MAQRVLFTSLIIEPMEGCNTSKGVFSDALKLFWLVAMLCNVTCIGLKEMCTNNSI